MRFQKVEGAGNDYVLVDAFRDRLDDPAAVARAVSDRHTGVGSDGLLLVGPPPDGVDAAAEMRMFNADGSEGRMCGNGLRCVVRWLVREGRAPADEVRVATAAGARRGRLLSDVGAGLVEVSMGRPELQPEAFPAAEGHAVSVGNPHVVIPVDDPARFPLERRGPELEHDPRFPDGVNVHVTTPRDGALLTRTWERGSGLTRACGTGAVAVAAVARAQGWLPGDAFVVAMPGGRLEVRFDPAGEAWLAGPARLVFRGDWDAA